MWVNQNDSGNYIAENGVYFLRPQVLKDAGELEEFIDENEVSVVGFFEEGGCIAHKKFQEVADGDIKRPYGVVLDPHVRPTVLIEVSGVGEEVEVRGGGREVGRF